ncbi:MAG: hypothetical protein H0V76_03900, partial [Blastocatellia bacterium]|nr:hypothetical protein [Blastocatellia bacterium]
RLWLGTEFEARSYPILVPHAASFGLIAVGIVAWHTAEAFRKPGINAATSIVLATVAIILMLGFVGGGEEGIAYGRVIGAAITLPVVLYVERTCFGRPLFAFWAANAAILTTVAALIGYIQTHAISVLEVSWHTLILTAVAGTCGFLAAMLLTRFLSRSMIADLRRS